ncbi:hypothetical protein QVD17_39422 [Tagetes erecta]|uniref:Uncharacterized protein n=1 Tax=Tagetes erecta TaxID=13708 RepID=A0AAD8JNH9_TARER|nr:hypothetical protein QVD17_39422 [Tagetes erecta]
MILVEIVKSGIVMPYLAVFSPIIKYPRNTLYTFFSSLLFSFTNFLHPSFKQSNQHNCRSKIFDLSIRGK